MKISRIKNRISEAATEACGYSPLTKVVSEEEINRNLGKEKARSYEHAIEIVKGGGVDAD